MKAFGVYKRKMVSLHFNIIDLVLGLRTRQVNNALDSPCSVLHVLYALSAYGNLSRHLDTCVSFEGRFSTDKAKEALVLEQ